MNKIATFNILKDINIVVEYYRGQIYIEDFINLKKKLFSEELYHYEIEILMDIREADLMINESGLSKYVQFAKNNIENIGDRKVSILTNMPNQVVAGVLFETLKENLPMKTKVFSTLEGSIRWLNVNIIELDRINNILKNLSKGNLNMI